MRVISTVCSLDLDLSCGNDSMTMLALVHIFVVALLVTFATMLVGSIDSGCR